MMDQQCRYDIEGLIKELEVEIDEIVMLFLNYISEMEDEIDSMNEYLSKEDWNMLQRVVHNVKGVSSNLGINDVFEEATHLDILLKQGKTNTAETGVEQLTDKIKAAEDEIRQYFSARGFSL